MGKLVGKIAVVTGASKGIGAGIASALAAEGAAVVVNYASSAEGADRVVAEISQRGGKAVAIQADVARVDEVRRLFAQTKELFGHVDVLVNNAGVYQFAPLESITEEEFHRQFGINVLGTILSTQEAVKLFRPEGGSVINVSSVISQRASAGATVYAATKGAIDSVTRVLAVELAARRIRVNTLAPGAVETEGTHSAGIVGSDFQKQIIADTPLGRIGRAEDIARVAVFLASDDAGWVTGERLSASGGL